MSEDSNSSSDSSTLPPWRKSGSGPPAAVVSSASEAEDSDESIPEWKKKLNTMKSKPTSPNKPKPAQEKEGEPEPEWMKKYKTMKEKSSPQQIDSQSLHSKQAVEEDLPEWKRKLMAMKAKSSPSPETNVKEASSDDNIPEWKKKFNEMKQRESTTESSERTETNARVAKVSGTSSEQKDSSVEHGLDSDQPTQTDSNDLDSSIQEPRPKDVVEVFEDEPVGGNDEEEEYILEEYEDGDPSERDNIYAGVPVGPGDTEDDPIIDEIIDQEGYIIEEIVEDEDGETIEEEEIVMEEEIVSMPTVSPSSNAHAFTSTPASAPDDEAHAFSQVHRPIPQTSISTFQPSQSTSFSAYRPPIRIAQSSGPLLPDPGGSHSVASVRIEPDGFFPMSEEFNSVSSNVGPRNQVALLALQKSKDDDDESKGENERFFDEEDQGYVVVEKYRERENPWLMALVCLLFLGLLVAAILLILALVGAPPFDDDDGENGGTPTMPPSMSPTMSSTTTDFVGDQPTTPMAPYVPGQCPVSGQINPNIISQCECDGEITELETDVRAKYDALVQDFVRQIYPSWSFTIESCDPANMAVVWLATGFQDDETDLLQRYVMSFMYYNNDGTEWESQDSWLTDADVCTWYGLACTNQLIALLALEDNRVSRSVSTKIDFC